MPVSDGRITTENLCTGSVQERNIAADAVTSTAIADGAVSITAFASGINPVQVVSSLPGTASEGDMAYLTTDNKLYRYDGAAWTVEVDGVDIKANSITAGQIAAGAVSTDELAANAVTAAKIAAGTITATELDSDSVTADKIAAGEITVEKLVIGSFDNLIQDGGFESGNLVADSIHTFTDSGGTWATTSASSHSGDWSARYDPASQAADAYVTFAANPFSCRSGDTFYLSAYHTYGAGTGINDSYFQMLWYDSSDTFLSATTSTVTPTASWTLVEKEHTAPSGAAYGVFRLGVQNDAGGAVSLFDDVVVRRKVGQLVIEDQAVDIQRQEDPIHGEVLKDGNLNDSLTTTTLSTASVTHTIPSWVGTAYFNETATAQMSASASPNLLIEISHAGTDYASREATATNGETLAMSTSTGHTITAPASSITVACRLTLSTGTNSSNSSTIVSHIVGVR